MHLFLCILLSTFLSSCTPRAETVHVQRVIDGDTLLVRRANGREEKVRVVGIDTPETVDPRKPIGCFGPEASAEMHRLVDGKDILLQPKPDEDRDKYGRLLRYVRLGDRDIGAVLIQEGYARNYPWFPHPRLKAYAALEKTAKSEGKGLWSACVKRKK